MNDTGCRLVILAQGQVTSGTEGYAEPVDHAYRGSRMGFELKWDGVRAITYVERSRVRVVSRNDLDVTEHYPELAALAGLLVGRDVVVDGEVIAQDERAGRRSLGCRNACVTCAAPNRGCWPGCLRVTTCSACCICLAGPLWGAAVREMP